MTSPDRLPTLYSIRGWNETVNPAYISFTEAMRSTGVDVVDVYVPPVGFVSLGEWAAAFADLIMERQAEGQLHLMSYCLGGVVTQVALDILRERGVDADFVALIDVRHEPPAFRLDRGLDSLYRVPWGFRIRHQLLRLTPPESELLTDVLSDAVRRSFRSVIELPKRGWRSRRRINPLIFTEMFLAHGWEFGALLTPVHLYNATTSIATIGEGDPSMHLSRYLRGGFALRLIEGTHENCIEPPHSAALIELITADRVSAMQGRGLLL